MNKRDLWLSLKAYHFNHIVETHLMDVVSEMFGGTDASTKAFASKLASKLGWTKNFALKALDEYKKFVFLAVTADFSVTPSKIIDQVWHEHLLFSRAYREFCAETIQFTLDHSPELVPMVDQTGTFNAQYLATLELYKKEFNVEPPAEFWSKPKFDQKKVSDGYTPKKKKNRDTTTTSDDNTFLYMYFMSADNSAHSHPEFNFGGGQSDGAGAEGNWHSNESQPSHHDSTSHSHGDSHSDSSGHGSDSGGDSGGHGGDSGGGDSGGGDSGGGDSGGSSCSSGCSSGCGGGCGS